MYPFKSLLAACALISGCNGVPTAFVKDSFNEQAFVVHSGGPLPMLLMGTAVQWNAEYAVTVKHLPYLPGSVYQGQGDVQFFLHPANTPLPSWRQYKPGEMLTAVGYNSLYMPIEGTGRALPAMVRLDAHDGGVMYATHDGATAKGMSGGPVFAADGEVVGINVAYLTADDLADLKRPDLANEPRVSIFMPYTAINHEWQRFAAQQRTAAAAQQPAPALAAR